MARVILVFCILFFSFNVLYFASAHDEWTNWGNGLFNTRWVRDEHHISPNNVHNLGVEWVFNTDSDVSTTITVSDDKIFFTDFSGNIYSVHRDGTLFWKVNIADLLGLPAGPNTYTRTSPTVFGDSLILGSQQGAYVFSVNKHTGALNWKTQLSAFPYALVTQSPTIFEGKVYIGTSSSEETAGSLFTPGYVCCVFIGEFFRLDAHTGAIEWKTPMLPDNGGQPGGYSGAAIWGSSPSIDPLTRTVFIATGNNYNVPASVAQCQENRNAAPNPAALPSCITPDNRQDSFVALDLDTGSVKWSKSLDGWDAWTLSCGIPNLGLPETPNGNCPPVPGPDYDFGQAPMFLPGVVVHDPPAQSTPPSFLPPLCQSGDRDNEPDLFTTRFRVVDLVVAGQKSGVLWALNARTGEVVWSNQVCPGGAFGGMMWGSTTDGVYAYVACANFASQYFNIPTCGSNTVLNATAGIFASVRLFDGRTNWATADPAGLLPPPAGRLGRPLAAVTYANGLVYGASIDFSGSYYIMRASDGTILKTIESGGSVLGGATVLDGHVYWGCGYARTFLPCRKVYALSIPN